jgi:sialic acid synthase SpsE
MNRITQSRPVYIIAEAGVNHGGDLGIAAHMVEVAADAGVDAVKFQSFTAGGLTHAQLAADQHEFFSQFELSRSEHEQLAGICSKHGVDFLSTPFDFKMADMLEELEVPAYKIASCDLTNLPLIRRVARTGKPVFISTGMGNMFEVSQALAASHEAGSPRTVMLQCTTNYPTAHEHVNLRAMVAMAEQVGCPVGYSDHSIGNLACFAAVALGAEVIEKHFCLDKSAAGPDIPGSCDPDELKELVAGIRTTTAVLGSPDKELKEHEAEVARIARRSIYYAHDLKAGHIISENDLVFLRPAGGMSPAQAERLLGRELVADVKAGDAADPAHART